MTLGARRIDAVNTAFLREHKIVWRSQLFGHRVCEAYGAIQRFMYQGKGQDYASRLCNYADLLYLEMVRGTTVCLQMNLTLKTVTLRSRPATPPYSRGQPLLQSSTKTGVGTGGS